MLRKRLRNELSDAGASDGSDSDPDSFTNQDKSNHQNTTIRTDEYSRSYDSDHLNESRIHYSHTSHERSYTASPGREFRRIPESMNYGQSRAFKTHSAPKSESSSTLGIIVLAFGAAIVIVCCAIYGLSMLSSKPKEPISCPQFKELTKHFRHQDMLLWKSLKVGIENVINENPAKPSVFLLAYSDIETSRDVMAKILNATAECMQTTRPIQLNGATFATPEMVKDYGEIIAKYRNELKQEKIMYVSDVNKTPAAAAQVFHTICDTVEPLVEKAVIFLTVYLEPGNYEQNAASVLRKVEQTLETNWHSNAVSENTLKALIGRVTDQVFLLHSESVST